jgi:hypothetical protein
MPFEEAARGDARFGMEAGDAGLAGRGFEAGEKGGGGAAALLGGMDEEHVDVSVGLEVDEAGRRAVALGDEGAGLPARGRPGVLVDLVGCPRAYLRLGIVRASRDAHGGPEDADQRDGVFRCVVPDLEDALALRRACAALRWASLRPPRRASPTRRACRP